MTPQETVYILGSGAIGFPLAAYLAHAGRDVVAVRTSKQDVPKSSVTVTVQSGADRIRTPVETVSLAELTKVDGIIVVASKSYANQSLAQALSERAATGPVVIMQNGVGVEKPFVETHFSPIYRCVLYITSQATSNYEFHVRPVSASPIGVTLGDAAGLQACVDALTTDAFPFRSEANIRREVWKKAIINAVFNSICPLLEVDNGIFVRELEVASLAREIVGECVALTDKLDMGLSEGDIMDQLMRISKGSEGQLISTLQDIRSGRETEIEFLNLEIARTGASMRPSLQLPKTELLGKMIATKAMLGMKRDPQA